MNIVFYDTETSGLKNSQLVTLSGWKWNPDEDKVIGEFNLMVKPKCDIDVGATQVNKYCKESVDVFLEKNPLLEEMRPDLISLENSPELTKEHLKSFYDFVGDPKETIICGHNIKYDNGVMMNEERNLDYTENSIWKYQSICTLEMARALLIKGKDVENHKLFTVLTYFNIDSLGEVKTHNSAYDALATMHVYKNLMKRAGCKTVNDYYKKFFSERMCALRDFVLRNINRRCEFDYLKDKATTTERKTILLQSINLAEKNDGYIEGIDVSKNETRNYKISRFKSPIKIIG